MALPTPLTITQVDGAQDSNEVRALFRTGPHQGLALFVLATDPNLGGAIADGSVLVQFPGHSGNAPRPTLTSVSPSTVSAAVSTDVDITGTGFRDTDEVMIVAQGQDASTATSLGADYVSPTLFTRNFSGGGPIGSFQIFVRTSDGYDTPRQPLTITA